MEKKLQHVLLAPIPETRVDAAIQTTTVTDVKSVMSAVESKAAIITIGDMRLLECLLAYPDLFGCSFAYLQGLPGATYTPAFDQLTYSLDRVAYDVLVADALAATRMRALKDAESTSRRDDGAVRDRPMKDVDDVAAPDRIPGAFDVE